MKNSRYVDVAATVNVIGNLYKNPSLLEETDKYNFTEDDFPNIFMRNVFGCIYNLFQLGNNKITMQAIESYLAQRPKIAAEFKTNKGAEFLVECGEKAEPAAFNYYYNRIKKMSLLRAYESLGMDLAWLYDPDNIFDSKKKQEQEDFLDNHTVGEINNRINDRIEAIKAQYVDNYEDTGAHIGDDIEELIESLKATPALGYPFYSKYMNTLTRGARFSKFFLRSAPTGVGKSRSMIGDACFIGCSQMYDLQNNKWISIGACQPTLYIATEQNLQEIQTMALAFIAGVDEDHILKGEYFSGEEERIHKAAQLLRQSKLYFECLPDFSMSDIENTMKKHIREHQVYYHFYDYIHTSTKMLTEIGSKSGIKNLREDNLLFLLSTKLKDLAVQYDVFVMSSTQLNMAWTESETPDQNLLRGSKAIADRLDWGSIMLDVTKEDKEKLAPFINKNGLEMPNVKLSVYKCRQGQYKGVYLWLNANKGCCRFDGSFVTKWDYTIMEVEDLKIKTEEESAF